MKKLLFLSLSLMIFTKASALEICPRLILQETIQNGHDCNPYGEIIIKVEGLDDGVYNHNFYYDTPDNKAVAFGNATVVSGVLKLSVLPGVYRNIRFAEDNVCGNIGDVTIQGVPQPLLFDIPKFCSLENKTLKDIVVLGSEVVWYKESDLINPIIDLNIPLVEGDKYSFKSGCLLVPYTVEVDRVEKPIFSADCTLGAGKAKISITNPIQGYTYSLDGGIFQSMTEFMDVSNGVHYVTARSENDCTAQSDVINFYCDSIELIVYIPDVEFKNQLVNNESINTNGDKEIQVSEALKVTSLYISFAYSVVDMSDSYKCLKSLEGLQYFENLTDLRAVASEMYPCSTSIPVDLSGLKFLTHFECAEGGCSYVNLDNNLSLKHVDVQHASNSFKGCYNLETFRARYSNLDLDFTNYSNLKLIRSYVSINSLKIKGCTSLESVELEADSNITSLDFSDCINLKSLFIGESGKLIELNLINVNNLEELVVSAEKLDNLDLSNMSNLKTAYIGYGINNLNIKNGSLFTAEPISENNYSAGLGLEFAYDLKSICVDEGEYEFVKGLADKYGYKPTITTDCTNLSVSENEFDVLNTAFSPNPTQGKITFTEKVDEVKVFDLSGRLVKSIIVNTSEVDLTDLTNGVYILQVSQNQKMFTAKVVKE